MAIVLEHETHPAIALKIIRTQQFQGGPIAADSGLNSYIVGRTGYYAQLHEHEGAQLEFEWDGPVIVGPVPAQPAAGSLIDAWPHRAFLPHGTSQGLVLKKVTLIKGKTWTDAVSAPQFDLTSIRWWGTKFSSDWEGDEAKRIQAEVRRKLANPLPIAVVQARG